MRRSLNSARVWHKVGTRQAEGTHGRGAQRCHARQSEHLRYLRLSTSSIRMHSKHMSAHFWLYNIEFLFQLYFFPPLSFHQPSQVRLGDYMVGLLTSPFKGESLIFHASIAWSRVHEFIGDVSKQAISRMVHKLFHSVERGLGRKEKKKEKKKILLLFFVVILECNDIHKGTHGAVACNVHVSDIRRNVVPRQCSKQITSRSILVLTFPPRWKKRKHSTHWLARATALFVTGELLLIWRNTRLDRDWRLGQCRRE